VPGRDGAQAVPTQRGKPAERKLFRLYLEARVGLGRSTMIFSEQLFPDRRRTRRGARMDQQLIARGISKRDPRRCFAFSVGFIIFAIGFVAGQSQVAKPAHVFDATGFFVEATFGRRFGFLEDGFRVCFCVHEDTNSKKLRRSAHNRFMAPDTRS